MLTRAATRGYRKAYRLTTENVLAKADFSFEFENGWKLVKISDKSDNSTIANTLAGELKTILSAGGIPVAASQAPPKSKERVMLFRAAFDDRTGYFKTFEPAGTLSLSDLGLP